MAAVRNAKSGSGRSASKAVIPQLPWSQVCSAPVVLVSGPEDFLADRAIRHLRDDLRSEDAGLEISDLDASMAAAGELLTLASPSLFAEPRLIRVSKLEKCNDVFLAEALAYVQQPADGAVLVLRHAGGV